jgi:hypothetical protein
VGRAPEILCRTGAFVQGFYLAPYSYISFNHATGRLKPRPEDLPWFFEKANANVSSSRRSGI